MSCVTFFPVKVMHSLFPRLTAKKEAMNFQGSRRRGEDGIAIVIDFLLSNARLVLGVGGAAILGIATLAVKRVSVLRLLIPHQCIFLWIQILHESEKNEHQQFSHKMFWKVVSILRRVLFEVPWLRLCFYLLNQSLFLCYRSVFGQCVMSCSMGVCV